MELVAISFFLPQTPARISCVFTMKLQGSVRASHRCSVHIYRVLARWGVLCGCQKHPSSLSLPQQLLRF